MNRGIIITAVTPEQVRTATALAYSIQINNSIPVSLVVPKFAIVKKQFEEPFENIIEFPYKTSEVLRANDWQLYWCTPYDETIFLDCHQLVKMDLENVWEYLSDHYDLYFNTDIKDFKYNPVPNLQHQTYSSYCDKRVYSNFIFWRSNNDTALSYFKVLDPMLRNWRAAFENLVQAQHVPETLDIDMLNSIVLHNLDLIDQVCGYDVAQTTNLSINNQLFSKHIQNNYLEYFNIWNTDTADIKIQNYKASGIIDYDIPEFLTDEIFNANRNVYRYTHK